MQGYRRWISLALVPAACASLAACGGGGAGAQYSVGGSASGFSGTLQLLNNAADRVTLQQPGSFRFAARVPSGAPYSVSVGTQPPAQYCSVSGGSGIARSDVSNVSVLCAAGTLSVLHAFGDAPGAGAVPAPGLAVAPDGTLYAATTAGGVFGFGAVVRLRADGTQTVLYSFRGGQGDGGAPLAAPTLGSDGNLYGSTSSNGLYDAGVIYKLTPGGVETVLLNVPGGSQAADPQGVLPDANGNLYIVSSGESTQAEGALYMVTAAGALRLLHVFGTGAGDLVGPVGTLLRASDGAIYGCARLGGADNDGGVFRFDPATGSYSVVASFSGANGSHPAAGLLQASDGNLYGTTYDGGSANQGTVFRLTTAGALSTLYSFAGGSDGGNPVSRPYQGSDGNLYLTTQTGGANGSGTLVRLPLSTPAAPQVLYSFGGAAGLGAAQGALVAGPNGYLYGSAKYGGVNGKGGVYQVN